MHKHADTGPSFEEGIDRRQLRLMLTRFRAISTARLARVREMLDARHRQFVDLLPLLLHANHPTLPGYVSQETPSGISGYTPPREILALARRVARSFVYHERSTGAAGVHAVYLMGSPGTLGHSDASDLDFWICYPEDLDAEHLGLLQRKIVLLQQWAAGMGLEAHLFLMNGEKFQRGQREPLTGENCGTAQHYLLLDEFYRTGILLAGRMPAWWVVPGSIEAEHADFCRTLTQKRYIRAAELVDFGGIPGVPAGEFVGAGIWQLYKAIDSPYKSVLKLLLFEAYASNFPETRCLSADYKRAVARGITDIDELDPYMMIYRRLEQHLLQLEQPVRLDIVRRCLYYKAGKKLSQAPREGSPSWQRLLMQRLTEEWGWDAEKLARLDARASWKIHEVGSERNELIKELNHSYRFLAEFARQNDAGKAIDAQEFSVLGRKLYAAHERKAGKIDTVNPGHSINVAEPELAICTLKGGDNPGAAPLWGAFAEAATRVSARASRPLKQSACLGELLTWCLSNGVIDERTRISTREREDGLKRSEVMAMLSAISEHIVGRNATPSDDAFGRQAQTQTLLVFFNVAADPLKSARELGLQRVSSRTDSLGYSALRENLVVNIETLVRNSWGEMIGTRYNGEEGLIRCIRDFLQLPRSGQRSPPQLVIRCHSASRAAAIAARMEELFADLERFFQRERGLANGRYVLAIQDRLHLIQMRRGTSSAQQTDSSRGLFELLGAAQAQWSPVAVDRYALPRSPLPLICRHAEPHRASVFCESTADAMRLTIVDENGSFFHAAYPGAREGSLLGAIEQFLSAARMRQSLSRDDAGSAIATAAGARYFRITRDSSGEHAVTPLEPARNLHAGAFLTLQAIAEPLEGEGVLFTVYCEGTAFSQGELGTEFHARVAAELQSRRRSREHYPVYITDLDLSAIAAHADAPLQTVHYLDYKRRLESGINHALGLPSLD
jgi:adenylate cyclase, class 1